MLGRALSLTVFVSAAVWACALFLYQWHHDGLTAMETFKATPDALGEMPVVALLSVVVGATAAWRLIEGASLRRARKARERGEEK